MINFIGHSDQIDQITVMVISIQRLHWLITMIQAITKPGTRHPDFDWSEHFDRLQVCAPVRWSLRGGFPCTCAISHLSVYKHAARDRQRKAQIAQIEVRKTREHSLFLSFSLSLSLSLSFSLALSRSLSFSLSLYLYYAIKTQKSPSWFLGWLMARVL